MLKKIKKSNLILDTVLKFSFLLAMIVAVPSFGLAQISDSTEIKPTDQTANAQQTAMVQAAQTKDAAPVLTPFLKDYKEVAVGMTAKDVRDKLGKPEISDEQGFFYKFSDQESAQILLDGDKNVRVISMMYVDKDGTAPKLASVFGAEAQATPNDDGSIYKMVRYPDAGYLVVYSRGAGDSPMVVVTMQKL